MAADEADKGALSRLQLTLYHMAPTRSARVVWLAHELGIVSEMNIRHVNLSSAEHKQPRLLQLNRMGAIPILHVEDKQSGRDTVMTESAAICDFLLFIVDDARRDTMMPTKGQVLAMAVFKRFCTFAVASMDPLLWTIRRNEELLDEASRDFKAAQHARREFVERVVPVLEQQLDGVQYVCEPERSGFCAADVMVGYSLAWASRYELVQPSAILRTYLQRVSSREAFRSAMRRARS